MALACRAAAAPARAIRATAAACHAQSVRAEAAALGKAVGDQDARVAERLDQMHERFSRLATQALAGVDEKGALLEQQQLDLRRATERLDDAERQLASCARELGKGAGAADALAARCDRADREQQPHSRIQR